MKFFPLIEGFISAATAPGAELAMSRQKVGDQEYWVFDTAPDSLRDMFAIMLAHGDLTFIVEDENRYSFADLYRSSAQFAHALVSAGVLKGDRVGIFMRNRVQWIIAYIGAAMAGAVVTPLNSWWGGEELHYALSDCDARVLVADTKRAVRVNADIADLAGLQKIVFGQGPEGWRGWNEFLAGHNESEPPVLEILPEDNATLMYTSGSTGHPKGALSTQRQVVSTVLGYALGGLALKFYRNGGQVVEDDKQLSALLPIPLFHVTGCVVIFLVSIIAARKLVLMRKWDAETALQLIEREQISGITGVPTQTADLMHKVQAEPGKYDVSSLVDLSAGGAKRPADQVDELQQTFPTGAPLAGYGLTETNGIGAFIAGDAYLANPNSIGKPVRPLVELEIRDPDTGAQMPDGERGEIWIKSVCNIAGYWNQPETNAAAFTDGWFHTGDVGVFDEQGLLYIVDRIKDIIIRGGENIATLEVESVISALPQVKECAVFGVPDERFGEAVACAVALHEGAQLDEAALQAELTKHLAAYKIPSLVHFQHKPLPRIATGKIAKKHLREAMMEVQA